MAKKEQKESVVEVAQEEQKLNIINKIPPVTHYSFSMIQNQDESYSVIKIGFNPIESYVSPSIEVVETNTDKYIIQERVSILLLEMESL